MTTCQYTCNQTGVTVTSTSLPSSPLQDQQFPDSTRPYQDGMVRGLGEATVTPLWTALLCTALAILWVTAIFGNILVCIVIQRSRRVQSTTNFFVKSLAVSDALLVLLTTPTLCIRVAVAEWIAGHMVCRMIRFVQVSTMACNSFVLIAICVDRFYTIVHPLSFKVTRGTAKKAIVAAWISPLLLSTFSFYFFDEVLVPKPSQDNPSRVRHICPTYIPAMTTAGRVYSILIVVIYYIAPAIIVTVGHLRIMCYIYRTRICVQSKNIGAVIPRAKVKIARTLMVITVLNFALYLPFFIVQLAYSINYTSFIHPHVFTVTYCLIAVSSTVKPIVYACRNSIFWRGCQEVLCMSGMKCYRVNSYTITKASTVAKRNFVGVMELSYGHHNHGNREVSSFDKNSDILPTTTF